MKNKIGRNDLCHCGSGKKYKKCCIAENKNLIVDETYMTQIKEEVESKIGGKVKLSRIDNNFDFDKYNRDGLLEDMGDGLYRVKKSN